MEISDICKQPQLSHDNDFGKFVRTIINEIQSPVLETYEHVYVKLFTDMINTQRKLIQDMKENGDVSSETLNHCQIYEMEIQRIEYYITLYTKTRLRKIHELSLLSLSDENNTNSNSVNNSNNTNLNRVNNSNNTNYENNTNNMTNNEKELYRKYREIRANFYDKNNLKNVSGVDGINENKYVFVRVLNDIGNFKIHPDDEDVVDLESGLIYLLPYKSIKDYISTRYIELI